ncbi:hypothetical protein KJ742_06475 [Patescibacteria group bacterium]|nr:hypothetical protein [Patescibacteria group bacterium]MBU1683557.1 hypothetical protein [Patescibacteria group bacterium]
MVKLTTTQPNEKDSQNVLNPITGSKAVVEKLEKRERTKNLRKAYAYLSVAVIMLAVYSFFFLYPQSKAYLETPNKLISLENDTENYENVVLPNLEKEKDLHKAAYDQEFQEMEDALDNVFPPDTDKLGIVKRLEDFATSIHTKTPPFEFNSISFDEVEEVDGYSILPISTSIHSSTTNFDRFLQLINLSGDLDSDIQVRLMEISKINVRYRGVDARTGEDQGVDFSVQLNAYSR